MALSAGSVEIRLFAELARLQSDMKKANKVVEDAMGGIQKTVRGATSVFNNLAGAFGSAQIIKLADEYKRFDSQLKLSTKSVQDYNEAYANTIRIGRTAQSDIGAIGVLYARLNNNLRDFNITQREVADVTETISLALRVNNATVQETNSTMLQLSQSFGSGRLNGQEFLAVAEGAPALLRQVAKALNVNYGELKDLSAQGKITRDVLLQAWTDPEYLNALRQQVKEVGTVTSSITVLMNNLKQFIGESDKATGATKVLSTGIILIAENLDKILNVAVGFGIVQFVKWSQGQYAAIVASKLLAKETAQNAQLQILNAEKTALAAKVKSDLLKLELVAEQNKQNAVLKTTQIERLNLIEKIKYEQQTLLVIQAARSEAIAINNAALAKQNDAIRTLESVRNMATLSGTIYAQKQAQDQLNAALAKRGLIMTELANLGRQQASVNAQITASTLALQKAEQALTITEKVRGVNLANNASLTTRLVHDYDKAVNVTNNVTKATSAAATAVRGFGTILSAFGGWVGLAITAVVLFGEKAYKMATATTPMLEQIRAKAKEMNDELNKTPEIMNKVTQSNLQQLAQERAILEQKIESAKKTLKLAESGAGLGLGIGVVDTTGIKANIKRMEGELEASLALYQDFIQQKSTIDRGYSQQQIDDAKARLDEYKTESNLRAEYERKVAQVLEDGKITGRDVTAQLKLLKEEFEKATTSKIKFTEEYKYGLKAIQEEIENEMILVAEAGKVYEEFATATAKAREDQLNASIATNEEIAKEIETTKDNIELIRLGEDAYAALTRQKQLDAIATAEGMIATAKANGATAEAIKYAEEYTQTLRDRLELQDKLNDVKRLEKNFKKQQELEKDRVKTVIEANREIERDNDRMYNNLGRSITDSIVRGFDNGLSVVDNFKQTVRNLFKSFTVNVGINFFQQGLQAVFGNATKSLLGSVAGLFSSDALASTGGGLGGLTDIFNVFTKGLDGANIAFEQGIQQFGTFITKFGGIGESIGGAISQYSGFLSSAAPFLQAGISLLSGDLKGAAFQGAGAAIGSIFGGPIGGAIGSFLGGALGGLFGGGLPPRVTQSRTGIFSNGQFSAYEATDSGRRKLGMADPLDQLNERFARNLSTIFDAFGLESEISSNSLLTKKKNTRARFNATVNGEFLGQSELEFGKKGTFEQAFNSLVERALGSYTVKAIQASDLPTGIKQFFDGLVKSEDVAETINTLVTMKNALLDLPTVFNAVRNAMDTSVYKTTLDQLKAQFQATQTFVNLFYTDAEKFDIAFKQLQRQFSLFGEEVPRTAREYRALVESINVVDESTRDQYNGLIALAPAMDAYLKSLEDQANILGRLTPDRFRTFFDYVVANSYASAGMTIPAANMPSYDVGTPFVPNDGVAMLHKGERVITASDNMTMGNSMGMMVSLLNNVVRELNELKYDMKRAADGSQRSARELEDITGGDVTILTEVAA